MILMRGGESLPRYPEKSTFYLHAHDTPEKFEEFYHTLMPGSGGLRNLKPELASELRQIERTYPPANPDGIETLSRHTDHDGRWTPERSRLHDQIVKQVRGTVHRQANPEFVLLGGGTAAGKSTVTKTGMVALPNACAIVDSDAIKDSIPEYQSMLKHNDVRGAGYAHEESSSLAKRALREAFAEKQNIVLDGTGDSELKSVESKVTQARLAGFKVKAEYCTCPVETAIARSAERAAKTGRCVPDVVIKKIHASVSRIFPQAVSAGLFDEARLWDTDIPQGQKPILIASAVGRELKIHDEARWKAFLKKGEA